MQTCFLTANGALYLIDHKNGFTPAEFTVKESFLTNSIVQLESSLGHFLALKKKIRPSIKEWDVERLERWMGHVGFDFCQRVVKFGRINGAKLAAADYQFMSDTLGITDEN